MENCLTPATEDGTFYNTTSGGTSTVDGGGTSDDGATGGIEDDWTLVDGAVEEDDKVVGH